jgi:hypothetical protein
MWDCAYLYILDVKEAMATKVGFVLVAEFAETSPEGYHPISARMIDNITLSKGMFSPEIYAYWYTC